MLLPTAADKTALLDYLTMKKCPKRSSLWAELLVCKEEQHSLKCCPYCLDLKYQKQPTQQPKKVCPHTFSHRTALSKLHPQQLHRKLNTSNWLEKKMIWRSLLFSCRLDTCFGKHKIWHSFHLSFLTQIMLLTKSTYCRISIPRTKAPGASRTYTLTIIKWWSAVYPCVCLPTWYFQTLKFTKRFSLWYSNLSVEFSDQQKQTLWTTA